MLKSKISNSVVQIEVKSHKQISMKCGLFNFFNESKSLIPYSQIMYHVIDFKDSFNTKPTNRIIIPKWLSSSNGLTSLDVDYSRIDRIANSMLGEHYGPCFIFGDGKIANSYWHSKSSGFCWNTNKRRTQ